MLLRAELSFFGQKIPCALSGASSIDPAKSPEMATPQPTKDRTGAVPEFMLPLKFRGRRHFLEENAT
jgi:hypothetical protein